MNYIKQIKAFYDRLEENPLSTSAIALWHALMHANNKAGWTEEFSVAASLLCFRSGLAERTVSKARNELKQKGYIDFRSRKGNKSAVYRMIDLTALDADKYAGNHTDNELSAPHADNYADSHADNYANKYADNHADNHATLLNNTKQNETKTNDSDDDVSGSGLPSSRAVAFYTNNFGDYSSYIADEIEKWVADLSEDIVIAAMQLALKRKKKSFGYIEGILKKWLEEGLKTLDQVRAYEASRNEQIKKKYEAKGQQRPNERVDKLPKWATNNLDFRPKNEKSIEKLEELLSNL